jgi:hypothetical protein
VDSVIAPSHLEAFLRGPDAGVDREAPVLLAIGNCQAESLRVVVPPEAAITVRTPPVHELDAAQAAQLHSWLRRADFAVVQPIRDDYRGLPVGTRQLLASLRSAARVAVVPVIRYAGLYPTHLIIRPPSDTSLTPPVVAYHDAAVLAEAAGLSLPALTPRAVRAVASSSMAQLAAREERHGTVPVSDLFAAPGFGHMRTINHPGNPVWVELGRRVLDALGLAEPVRVPQRPLLDSVHAPRLRAVIDAFGLDDTGTDTGTGGREIDHWVVDGRPIATDEVRRAHLEWYAAHPDAVQAGLDRHTDTLRDLAA